MVCFSVCLIVCASPVFAGLNQTVSFTSNILLSPSPVPPFYFETTSGSILDPFFGYMQAVFNISEFETAVFDFRSDYVGSGYRFLKCSDSSYIEFLFNVSSPVKLNIDGDSTGYFKASASYESGGSTSVNLILRSVDFIVDGTYIPYSLGSTSTEFITSPGDYSVMRYFGYRFVLDEKTEYITAANNPCLSLRLTDNSSFSQLDFSNGDIIGSIGVNTGYLEEISGNVSDIKTQIIELNKDISDIKDTVSDTHDQLEDPDSNIWQAAGSAISGAIESLFVPSEQDIANVKQGFDDLAQDKLGGAYTAMETVEDTIIQVNDKLNNPSAAEGVEFPGIAVPLGGEVGTVVLAERQMVTLPMELTAILHPLGGTIISIIAGLGTFNVLKDMVECFLSGFSYAEYLHRNKGGSDE